MPEPKQICVIGCGGIAQAYLQAARNIRSVQVVATVDPEIDRATQAAAPFDARAFTSVEELLSEAADSFSAALVLTPPNTHEDITLRLLAAGKDVLCEKPLTTSTDSARRMLDAAAANGRLLMMGSKFRYTPDMAKARELLDEGVIGDVLLFENVFCARVDMAQRWNSVRAVAGGGVLLDNGCHSVDIARFLLGPIARVQAMYGKPVQSLEVEDTVRLMFEAQSGAMGAIDLSWSLNKNAPAYVQIYGTRGNLEIGWQVSRYRTTEQPEWIEFGQGYDKTTAFARQLENFAAVLDGAEPPVITERDAMASVCVIEAAYRSANEQKWHELG
jgi:predicted dehydrogenase